MTEAVVEPKLSEVLSGYEDATKPLQLFIDVVDASDLSYKNRLAILLYQASAAGIVGTYNSIDPISTIRHFIPRVESDLQLELNSNSYRQIRKQVMFNLLDEYAEVLQVYEKASQFKASLD